MIYFNVANDDDNADYEVDAHRVPQPHVCLDGGQSSSSGGAKYLVIMLLLGHFNRLRRTTKPILV